MLLEGLCRDVVVVVIVLHVIQVSASSASVTMATATVTVLESRWGSSASAYPAVVSN